MQYPISSMPGEEIGRVFGGAMANETLHVVDAIARNRPALVKSEEARLIMDIYMAANLSVERDEPIALPHNA